MKYLITENRLVDIVDRYLEDTVGKLRKYPLDHINARDDDFELVDKNKDTVFRYFDYEVGVEENLYIQMLSLFNLKHKELADIIEKWFSMNFPELVVLNVHPIIE